MLLEKKNTEQVERLEGEGVLLGVSVEPFVNQYH